MFINFLISFAILAVIIRFGLKPLLLRTQGSGSKLLAITFLVGYSIAIGMMVVLLLTVIIWLISAHKTSHTNDALLPVIYSLMFLLGCLRGFIDARAHYALPGFKQWPQFF
ncbi:MAG: hypothetical protein WCT08_05455 [Patescibacteria group bacterium]|jgi:hypothetical protein